MAKIDFYILEDTATDARERFACRLTNKVAKLDNRVHLLVADTDQLNQLDSLLWTFDPNSFLPHDLVSDSDCQAPVTLGLANESMPAEVDVLINLCAQPVPDPSGNLRIAEVVDNDAQRKNQSRENFKAYKQRGNDIVTHNIPAR